MVTPPRFDPLAPVPRRTLANLMATGVWRAAPRRLGWAVALGAAGALAVLGAAPRWWPTAAPCVALAAFGAYGLAAQKEHELKVRQRGTARLRAGLRWLRVAAVVLAALAALAGLLGTLAALTRPAWAR